MTVVRKHRTFTFEEYLLLERNASYKSEFLDGLIYSMSGGSGNHAFIAANALTALAARLRESGCRVATSDLRVALEDSTFSSYPDVTVICGPPRYREERDDVLLNPHLIAKVLSPSTENYDRGEKFERYKRIASLKGCLLISQEKPLAELWHREDEIWTLTTATGWEASLFLPSWGIDLPLSEIYEGVFNA